MEVEPMKEKKISKAYCRCNVNFLILVFHQPCSPFFNKGIIIFIINIKSIGNIVN